MKNRGFTLIELLIVIAIIAIIAGVVFVALNPLQRFQDSRDSRRWGDVTAMLSAVKIKQVDDRGTYLSAISTTTADTAYMIGTNGATGCDSGCTATTTNAACVDLTPYVTAGYLSSVPMDPSGGNAAKTLYYLVRKNTGVLTIGACTPELATSIAVSR